MSKRRALMVLGMHRSGTSALARVLSLRGAELPAHLMAANRGNESGYWEPAPIVEFDDALLDFFGVDWDDPFAPFQVGGLDAAPKKLHKRAARLLEQEFGESDLFVLKDPRICLLHDFWFGLLAQQDIAACPIVVMRPYAEVAHSLQRRDGANPESGVLLYVAYGLALAAATQGRSATFVTYDQLVLDWRATTDRIAAEQGLQWPRNSAYSGQDVGDFLQPADGRRPKLDLSPTLMAWADAVWDWFRARAEGVERDPAELAPIRAALAEAALTFAPLVAERRRRLRAEFDVRAGAERQAQAEHARGDDAHAGLARTAAERDAALAERDRVLAVYDAARVELERTQAAFREAQAAASPAQQAQLDALQGERDRALAERDRLLALYDAARAELERTQAAFREAQASGSPVQQAQIETLQAERSRALAQQETMHAELLRTQRAYAELEQRTAAQSGAFAALQAERDRVLGLYENGHAELMRVQAVYREAEMQAVRATERLVGQDAQVAELRAALERSEGERHAVTGQRETMQSERDRMHALYEAAQSELARTQAAYRDLDTSYGQVAARLAAIEPQLATLDNDLRGLARHRDAMQSERDRVHALYEAAQAELARTQAAFRDLDEDRTQVAARFATVAPQLATLEAAHAALDGQHQELARQREALQAELARTQAAHAQADSERNELARQRDALQGELTGLRTLFDEAQASLARALAERVELAARSARLQSELANAIESARFAEARLGPATERAALLDGERARADALAAERDDLLATRERLLALQDDTVAELQRTQQLYGALDALHGETHAELQRTQQVYTDLDAAANELRAELAQAQSALDQSQLERDANQAQAQSALEQSQHERDAHQAQAAALAEDGEQVRAQLALVHAGYAALQAQATELADEGERLRGVVGVYQFEREELAARMHELGGQLQTIVTERDELHGHLQLLRDERERMVAWSEQLGAELARSDAQLAELGQERDQLQQRMWALMDEQRRVGDELEDMRAQRAYLADDLQDTRASLSRTTASLQELGSVRAELQSLGDRLQAELAERRAQLEHAHDELQEIYASRSWRITEPLRKVTIAGRRVLNASSQLVHRPRRLLSLPAPSGPTPPAPTAGAPKGGDPRVSTTAAASDASAGAELLALPEPEYTRRRHPGLRAFLVAEFGDTAAAAALLRIDRYRLPVDTGDGRPAAKSTCTDAEARWWAAALGRRAGRRHVAGDAPDVSIVIPVYNQVPFTLACVDSLLAQQSRHSFEILIGDDASTDATAVAFAQPIEGVTHVRHASNLGFVRNCNATAAHARGRIVVMLNNDTQVLPGWLDELVDVLDGDASVGMVGSKLIYPDGRMQECGGIVWRDGSAWNFGRLDDPRKPEYCYRRDVDYVSGASIALSTALWKQLGGFDEHFVPAYAEDVDLAFRVRAAGLATVVQPLSQLLHFEGVSSGTDLGSGAKAYQVENLRKLHVRWAKVLAGHRANADRPELEKERGIARRVLFVDHTTLTPNEDAGSLVAFEILQSLRRFGYKVTFVPEDNFAHVGNDTRALQRLGIEAIYHPAYSRMEQFLAARRDPFDLVVMHHYSVGDQHLGALKAAYPDAKFVFLACDLHYLREMREAELSGEPAAMARALETRDRELAVGRCADAIMVYSEAERDLLAGELPDANVVLFPLVHDPIAAHVELAGRTGVCFVGGYRHPPNADGIAWFAEHAWPIVRSRCPDHVLHVVGSHMTDAVRALGDRKGVEIVGFVEDMEGFLAQRRVNVAPLRYGAGVKGKVSAALANGVPTVATPIAAEGMQLSPGNDILVGHTPTELAEQVIALLDDDTRWQQVSDAGLAYAARVTSRTSAHRRIRAMLGSIGLAPPAADAPGAA